jgi:hypothetical protein
MNLELVRCSARRNAVSNDERAAKSSNRSVPSHCPARGPSIIGREFAHDSEPTFVNLTAADPSRMEQPFWGDSKNASSCFERTLEGFAVNTCSKSAYNHRSRVGNRAPGCSGERKAGWT